MAEFVALPLQSGRVHRVPRSWWDRLEGPKPEIPFPDGWLANGCSYSPDRFCACQGDAGETTTCDFTVACVVHDWHYSGHVAVSRHDADRFLRDNMFRSIHEVQGGGRFPAWILSRIYYFIVRLTGSPFYSRHAPNWLKSELPPMVCHSPLERGSAADANT